MSIKPIIPTADELKENKRARSAKLRIIEKYDYKIGGTTSIDVTKNGLDKGWGIKEFARHQKIPLQEIIFFGDKIYSCIAL